jgi:hypothetical protein
MEEFNKSLKNQMEMLKIKSLITQIKNLIEILANRTERVEK